MCHAVFGAGFIVELAAVIEAEHAVIALRHDHAERAHVFGFFAQDRGAHGWLFQFDEAFGERQTCEFDIGRLGDEGMDRALPAEHEARRAAGDLRRHVRALLAGFGGEVEHLAPFFRIDRRLQQRIGDGKTRLGGHFFHPHEFVFGGRHVGGHFENAVTCFAERATDAHQFVFACECTGHGFAVFGDVEHGARCGEAERTGLNAFAHDF